MTTFSLFAESSSKGIILLQADMMGYELVFLTILYLLI